MLPNFIGVGTFRAGTTWLYKVLHQHPDVFLPNEKELMFFSRHYSKGIEWYEKFYNGYSGEKCVGDITPSYLSYNEAANRMQKHIPDAKIIVTLRNPVDQIWSLYNLWVNRGYTLKNLEYVIHEKDELLNNVMYYQHIKRFLEYYDSNNILILFYEDLRDNPNDYLKSIYNFLEIKEIYSDKFLIPQNKSRKPKNITIEKMIVGVGDTLRRTGFVGLKSLLSKTGVVNRIKNLNTAKTNNNMISSDLRSYINDCIFDDKKKLSSIVNRDLSFWI